MRLALRCLPLAAVLLFVPLHVHADLITNGGFETGPNPAAAMTLPVDDASVPGWTVTRNSIRYVGTNWNAFEGTRSIALNGTTAGGIAQTVTTSPGTLYTVKFSMGSDAFPGKPYVKWLRVEAAGQSQDFSFDGIHAWPWDIGWDVRIFSFTANSTTTTIEFRSLMEGDNNGPAIDLVRIEPFPVDVPLSTPATIDLAAPWPNPSTGSFEVAFTLPAATPIRLALCDLQGREVGVLADGEMPAGRHFRVWNGRASGTQALRAGIYFLRLEAAGVIRVRRIALTR